MESNNVLHKVSQAHVAKAFSNYRVIHESCCLLFIFLFSLCARKIMTLIKKALTISFTGVLCRRVSAKARSHQDSATLWRLGQAGVGTGNMDLGIRGTDRLFWKHLSVLIHISLSLCNPADRPRQITAMCLPGLNNRKGLFQPDWFCDSILSVGADVVCWSVFLKNERK